MDIQKKKRLINVLLFFFLSFSFFLFYQFFFKKNNSKDFPNNDLEKVSQKDPDLKEEEKEINDEEITHEENDITHEEINEETTNKDDKDKNKDKKNYFITTSIIIFSLILIVIIIFIYFYFFRENVFQRMQKLYKKTGEELKNYKREDLFYFYNPKEKYEDSEKVADYFCKLGIDKEKGTIIITNKTKEEIEETYFDNDYTILFMRYIKSFLKSEVCFYKNKKKDGISFTVFHYFYAFAKFLLTPLCDYLMDKNNNNVKEIKVFFDPKKEHPSTLKIKFSSTFFNFKNEEVKKIEIFEEREDYFYFFLYFSLCDFFDEDYDGIFLENEKYNELYNEKKID